jgi:hypothetical protein
MAAFTTKPKGIHANFTTDCSTCGAELTVTGGRIDRHECERPQRPKTLDDIRAALDRRAP